MTAPRRLRHHRSLPCRSGATPAAGRALAARSDDGGPESHRRHRACHSRLRLRRDRERSGRRSSGGTRAAQGPDRGPLHGIPIAVKDIIDMAGLPTRCGSASRAEVAPATRDAAVVRRLRQAGAVLIGKTVTHEFASGVISPPTRNPWDPARIPGGSSGGSGASVAAGSSFAALGSDTAGSIRIPASLNGVAGLKPTYGRVSRVGVFPLSWSLDTSALWRARSRMPRSSFRRCRRSLRRHGNRLPREGLPGFASAWPGLFLSTASKQTCAPPSSRPWPISPLSARTSSRWPGPRRRSPPPPGSSSVARRWPPCTSRRCAARRNGSTRCCAPGWKRSPSSLAATTSARAALGRHQAIDRRYLPAVSA